MLKCRAFAGRACDHDCALMRLDDAVHHRKSKSGAFIDWLGGEKRLEDALQRAGIHAGSVVADFQAQRAARTMRVHGAKCGCSPARLASSITASSCMRMRPGALPIACMALVAMLIRICSICVASASTNGAAASQRASMAMRAGSVERSSRTDSSMMGASAQAARRAGSRRLKVRNLPHQFAGAGACLADFLEVFQRPRIGRRILAGEFRVAQNGGDDIVEVVCHPPGQRAQGFHLRNSHTCGTTVSKSFLRCR